MIKVIIADDERLICQLILALADWESLGMEVVGTAENGLEALELVEKWKPDILITDIRMPGCDGMELIRKAKSVCNDLEVAIISGYAHFEYAQSAISYGVGNYLLKPVKKDELMETLQKMRNRIMDKEEVKEAVRARKSNLENLSQLAQKDLFQKLLSDKEFVLTKEELKEKYYFDGNGNCYQAFIVKIDCDTAEINTRAAGVIWEKIETILQSCLKDQCKEYCINRDGYIGYGILNYEWEDKGLIRKKIRDGINLMEAQKIMYGSVNFSIALGNIVSQPQDIGKSLQDAEYALKERLLEGTGHLLENVPKESGLSKQVQLDRYAKQIDSALETLDEETASKALENYRHEIMALPNLCAREIYDVIIQAGRFFVVRSGIENAEKVQEEFKLSCDQCSSVAQVFEQLEKLQSTILNKIKIIKDSESTRPIRLAKQYVLQHYQEAITLEEVCEAIGFSVSYFSVMFKKETGEGFSKYLTKVRIDEAKNLLRETNLTVADICERVGYNDRKHFTHTFKKIVGLNPAEYRKLYG